MKLDNFSKILIATGQINYMAASIDSVNGEMKSLAEGKNQIHKEGIEAKDELLAEVVEDLAAIMNKMGDLINNHDCICEIDTRVAKVPFEIIVSKMDDCYESYDKDDETILS